VTSNFDEVFANFPTEPCGFTGQIEVTYTIRDECGLPTFKTATFRVKDDTNPTPVCQDIVVQLGADGTVSIDPSQIDNGSNDICGEITLVSVNPDNFNPSQCGTTVQVELTIKDECDNVSTCLANVKVECFDLALRKTLAAGEDERVFPNDDVTFTIEVFNQGSLDASNIVVKDYIPNGLTLNDPDWANNGTIVIPFIAAGASETVDITLNATQQTDGQIINRAEIESADAPTGFTPTDIDSDPDGIEGNDAGGLVNTPQDDQIDGNSRIGEDEDDSDPEDITIGIFDLALRKEYRNTVPLKLGQTATFTITVFNQGTVGASNIEVVDYIPAGFQLVNNQTGTEANGWSGTGTPSSQVTTQINGTIPAGGSREIIINLEVLEGVVADGDYINRSEIVSATDDLGTTTADADSTPDDVLGNDAGGQNDSAADNFIDGNGQGTNGDGVAATDEDDEDPEDAPIFDLALTKKTLVGTPVKVNQVIPFTIEVTNQGNITARSVEISDYIPLGFDLAPTQTATWNGAGVGGTTVTTQIAGPIEPGNSETVTINLIVNGKGNQTTDYINVAEITSTRDGAGNVSTNFDKDSQPDNNATNDPGGLVNSPADDFIDGNGTGTAGDNVAATDEDDSDPEDVIVFDIALRKTLSNNSPIKLGETVQFTIEVFNQGNQIVQNIEVNDYIPAGFERDGNSAGANGTNWSGVGTAESTTTTIIGTPLAPGESTTVTIDLKVVSAGMEAADYINVGEINSFADENNTPSSNFDVDSQPDNDPTNDAGGAVDTPSDDVILGDGTGTPGDEVPATDEDDADPAKTQIFDLALRKYTEQTEPVKNGDNVVFKIEVTNQGNIPAQNIVINDYIPVGLQRTNALTGQGMNWSGSAAPGGISTTTYAPILQPGETVTLEINMTVLEAGNNAAAYINRAEIGGAQDDNGTDRTNDDRDSQPDAILGNDAGGQIDSPADDFLDGDGSGTDDH